MQNLKKTFIFVILLCKLVLQSDYVIFKHANCKPEPLIQEWHIGMDTKTNQFWYFMQLVVIFFQLMYNSAISSACPAIIHELQES